MSSSFVLFSFFCFGAIFGSFANVLILRVPKKLSLLPGSRCNSCLKPIRWYDNVPMFSWLLLRRKCRDCRNPISWRYPFVEMLMGLLFVVTYLKLGWCWTLLEIDILVFGLVVVTFIDLDQMILPDVFTLPGIVVGLVGAALNPERSFLSALIGMALGGGFLWLTAYLYWIVRKAEGMGGGDIKLLAWIGAVLGLASVPFIILVSSLVGTFVGMIVAYRTKDGLKTAIPYGPYLAFAALAYLLGGSEITYWYWNFFVTDLGLLQS